MSENKELGIQHVDPSLLREAARRRAELAVRERQAREEARRLAEQAQREREGQEEIERQRRRIVNRVAAAESRLGQTQVQMQQLSVQMEQLEGKRNRLQAKLANLQEQKRTMETESRKIQQDLAQIKARGQEMEQLGSKLHVAFERLRSRESQLHEQLAHADKGIETLTADICAIDNRLTEHLSAVGELQQRLQEMQSVLDRERRELAVLADSLDGKEAVQAGERIVRIQDKQRALQAEANLFQIELAASNAHPIVGAFWQELLTVAREEGHTVHDAAFSHGQVEVFITDVRRRTLRLAFDLVQQQENDTTRQMRALVEGRNMLDETECILRVQNLLERLKKKGVICTLHVDRRQAPPRQPIRSAIEKPDHLRESEQ